MPKGMYKLSDLIPDQKNHNKHTAYGMGLLDKSVGKVGIIESITVSADGMIISGNARHEIIGARFGEVDPIVVESDGTRPVILKRTDIKSGTKMFTEAAILANTTAKANIDIDLDVVEELLEEHSITKYDVGLEEPAEEESTEPAPKNVWVPDCLFASNNAYDIPTLKMHTKDLYIDLPFKPYGADARTKTGVGTYHFYVDDYRFEAIWDNPANLINSGCKNIIEPNLSLYETTPVSFGIFQIYKKRWIARFLQDYNVNIFVDLNVTEKFMPYNVLGIPKGYNAFCTRGYENRLQALEAEYNIAKDISGLDNPNFICYGGSKKVKAWCNSKNIVFINNTTLDV